MLSHILVLAFSMIILFVLFIFTGEVYTLELLILLLVLLVLDIVICRLLFRKLSAKVEMKSSSVAGRNVQLNLSVDGRTIIPFLYGVVKLKLHNITFDTTEIITKSFTIQDSNESENARSYNQSKVQKSNTLNADAQDSNAQNSNAQDSNAQNSDAQNSNESKNAQNSSNSRNITIDLDSEYCGKYEVTIMYVKIFDLLGMSYKKIVKNLKNVLYIYPVSVAIGAVSDAQRVNYEKERYFSNKKNTVLSEILQYREYQPGDNLRHINWKLSDRFDEMLVREFDTPTDNQVLVTFDIENVISNQSNGSKEQSANAALSVQNSKLSKSLVYSAIMSISASYIDKGIFHQVGWYRATDRHSIYKNMYRMEDLYGVMRQIFDDNGEAKSRSASIVTLIKSGNINKYAKVVYITNHIDKKVQDQIRLYGNIQLVLLDEKSIGESFSESSALISEDVKKVLRRVAV